MNAKVMTLGVFHFRSSLGHLKNTAFDVTTDERQAQISETADKIAAFKPTKIAVEVKTRKQKQLDERYAEYLRDGIIDTRIPWHVSETVMLGFQIAKKCGLEKLHAIDYLISMWTEVAERYAKRREPETVAEIKNNVTDIITRMSSHSDKTISEIFADFNNDPEQIRKESSDLFLMYNRIGAYRNYIGTRVLTAWYKRNLRIFANLQAICEDNDRVLVIYGSSHLPTLNSFIQDYSKMDFVSPLEYLRGGTRDA